MNVTWLAGPAHANPVWPPRDPKAATLEGRLYTCRCSYGVRDSDPAAAKRWVRHTAVCDRYWTDWRV